MVASAATRPSRCCFDYATGTILIADDFVDAPGTLLPDHVPATGGPIRIHDQSGSPSVYIIDSGEAGTGGAGAENVRYTHAPQTDRVVVNATWKWLVGTADSIISIYATAHSAGNDDVVLYYDTNIGAWALTIDQGGSTISTTFQAIPHVATDTVDATLTVTHTDVTATATDGLNLSVPLPQPMRRGPTYPSWYQYAAGTPKLVLTGMMAQIP